MVDTDPLLRRLQIGALLWCLCTAAIVLVVWPTNPRLAIAVLGGGLIAAVSFLTIKTSIDAALLIVARRSTATDAERRRLARRALARAIGRYALLALLAYVIIARLRLHPVGVVIGASSLVASAAFEATRFVMRAR